MRTEILDNRKILMPDEGFKLTDWNGENIMDYSSYTMVVAPLNADLAQYYEILDELDKEYQETQLEIMKTINGEI